MNGYFNDGDLVMLSSGGPYMTVVMSFIVSDVEFVNCCWFDGNECLQADFPIMTVQLIMDVVQITEIYEKATDVEEL